MASADLAMDRPAATTPASMMTVPARTSPSAARPKSSESITTATAMRMMLAPSTEIPA